MIRKLLTWRKYLVLLEFVMVLLLKQIQQRFLLDWNQRKLLNFRTYVVQIQLVILH
jgi:hypothetical protein